MKDSHYGNSEEQPRWFALQVRAKHEKVVAAHLSGRNVEWFLPVYKCRRPWSDRIKEIEAPLFPGYLFSRFDLRNRLSIMTIPGLVRIVGYGRLPASIEEAEVGAIHTLMTAGLRSQPWPFMAAGDKVRIANGPLRGVEGILVAFRGSHRLILSVTLLQRSVAVEIDSALVVPEGPTRSKASEAGFLHPQLLRAT